MPRYFFDLHNDMDVCDPSGRELPNIEAALANAVQEAREMMRESLRQGHLNLMHRIDIRVETGAIIRTVHFGDAVTVKRGDELLSEPPVTV